MTSVLTDQDTSVAHIHCLIPDLLPLLLSMTVQSHTGPPCYMMLIILWEQGMISSLYELLTHIV